MSYLGRRKYSVRQDEKCCLCRTMWIMMMMMMVGEESGGGGGGGGGDGERV